MKRILKILATVVWYIGFAALSLKAYKLFSEAYTLDDDIYTLSILITFAFLLSLLKTKYIFIKSYRKNTRRIHALQNPKIWEFFRARFFLFLVTIISLGAFLSRLASGDYLFLVSVGVVDLALALALFFSGFAFFEKERE